MSLTLTIESSICVGAAVEPWFGFDLDGTCALYPPKKGDGAIGKPIAPMIDLIKQLRAKGAQVRIVTARVGTGTPAEIAEATKEIQAWCLLYVGEELPVTAVKDYLMVVLFDDRAVQVEYNTGKLLGDPAKIKEWAKLQSKNTKITSMNAL